MLTSRLTPRTRRLERPAIEVGLHQPNREGTGSSRDEEDRGAPSQRFGPAGSAGRVFGQSTVAAGAARETASVARAVIKKGGAFVITTRAPRPSREERLPRRIVCAVVTGFW